MSKPSAPGSAIEPTTSGAGVVVLRRLEDAGITGVIQMPLLYEGQPNSSLDAKREAMERFAEDVIARFRAR